MWRGMLLEQIFAKCQVQLNSTLFVRSFSLCVYMSLCLSFAIFTLFLSHFIYLSHLPSRTQKCRQKVYYMSLSANGSRMRFPTVYTKNILIFYYDAKTYKIIFSTLFFIILFASSSLLAHRKLYVHTVHCAMLCCTFGKCMMKMLGPNLLISRDNLIFLFKASSK